MSTKTIREVGRPLMKLNAMMSLVGIAAAALVGCAGSEDGTDPVSDESNLTGQASSGATEHVDGISACSGRKPCVDAFVTRTLLASDLVLNGMPQGRDRITRAGEYVINWMTQVNPGSYATLTIDTTPQGGGQYRVKVTLGSHDFPDAEGGATESGYSFVFTIDRDTIVERDVDGQGTG